MIQRYWSGLGGTAVVAVLLTGAETALLHVLLAEIAGSFGASPLGWASLWALGLLAFFLPRALHGLPSRLYTFLVGTTIALTVLLGVYVTSYPNQPLWSADWLVDALTPAAFRPSSALSNPFLVALTLLGIWWRQMVRETPGSDAAQATFEWGAVPVAGLLIAGLAIWGTGPQLQIVIWRIAAFFILTLFVLAYTRWIETPQRASGGRSALSAWLGASTLPVGVAVLLTLGLSALLFGTVAPLIDLATRAVLSVVVLITLGVARVLTFLGWVLAWLLDQAIRLLRSIFPGLGVRPREVTLEPDQADRIRREVSEGLVSLPDWLVWAVVLLAGLLAVYALTRLRPRRESMAGVPVSRESVWERPDIGAGLRGLLGRLRRRGDDPLRALMHDPAWRHTAEVRRVYRDVQETYAREGRGREPSQTAWEHAASQPSPALAELASIYQEVRYSTRPAPPELARRARELRAQVRGELRTRE
ncbi:MAG: DUF4129 domain-containing protein [Chloroflexota bacterium]|nr:DUF4129 domain-containing protein [Chloroflexota bacterium]